MARLSVNSVLLSCEDSKTYVYYDFWLWSTVYIGHGGLMWCAVAWSAVVCPRVCEVVVNLFFKFRVQDRVAEISELLNFVKEKVSRSVSSSATRTQLHRCTLSSPFVSLPSASV